MKDLTLRPSNISYIEKKNKRIRRFLLSKFQVLLKNNTDKTFSFTPFTHLWTLILNIIKIKLTFDITLA